MRQPRAGIEYHPGVAARPNDWNGWNDASQWIPPVFVLAHIGMDNKDQAFAWMNKAYAQHSTALATLKVDPIFDPLRGDPRFHEFERRVGLAQ